MSVPPPAPEEFPQNGATTEGEASRGAALKDLAKSEPAPIPAGARMKNKTAERRDDLSALDERQKGSAGVGAAMATPSERASLREEDKSPERALKSEIAERKSQAADLPVPAAASVAPPVPVEADHAAARKETSNLGGLTIRGVQTRVTAKWRVGRRGSIQKADEAGTWQRVASGVDDDLFDITFAGDAGWAVGHEGTVLRSTDGGNTWRKVARPQLKI